jgi:hypothetical protein
MISLFFVFVLGTSLEAQIKIPTGTKTEINKFLKSTTYVVLKTDRMSEFNTGIKDAIDTHWTITPVKFVYESDFNDLRKDASNSFLMINQVYFEKDKSQTLFDFLILTIGGNYQTVNDMPTLCAIPLSYKGAPETDYDYKLGIIVKFVQKHVETCSKNASLNEDNIAEYYTQKSGKPDDKTLYLLKDEVEPSLKSVSTFKENYPFKYEFVSKEKIAELIQNNDKNAIIMHKIGPQNNSSLASCVKIIIDTDQALIYYYDMHKVSGSNSDNLLKSDLKKLSKKK